MILSKLIKLNNFRIKITKKKLTEKHYLKKYIKPFSIFLLPKQHKGYKSF